MAGMPTIDSVRFPDEGRAGASRSRRFKYLNVGFVATVAVLVLYGLAVVYSATLNNDNYNFSRQLMFVCVGAVFMLGLFRYDYHQLSHYTGILIAISAALTLLPHLPGLGMNVNGAQSWIRLGGLGLQPGELAKVTVILAAASCVSRYSGKLADFREYCKCVGLMLIPIIGIMTQPDLGTGMVYLFIDAVALIVGGADRRFILGTIGLLTGAVVGLFLLDPVLDSMAGHDVLLKDYQRSRLLVFMDNSYDPTGDGYNLQQAKIAIGSGGLFGKGYLNATQSTLGYLPESATDFIFCVLAEELGFAGAMALLSLYAILIVKTFRIAMNANDLFGAIIAMCIVGMWLFQILENIGMDIGLMPITGIPLPFVSYGSSFMIVNFILLGFIGSVWAHNGR